MKNIQFTASTKMADSVKGIRDIMIRANVGSTVVTGDASINMQDRVISMRLVMPAGER